MTAIIDLGVMWQILQILDFKGRGLDLYLVPFLFLNNKSQLLQHRTPVTATTIMITIM
jgi:hypothetical protein